MNRFIGLINFEKYNLKRGKARLRILAGYSEEEIISKESLKDNIYKFNGKEMTLPEISKLTGVKYQTLFKRIKKNKWSLERAINTPLRSFRTGLFHR